MSSSRGWIANRIISGILMDNELVTIDDLLSVGKHGKGYVSVTFNYEDGKISDVLVVFGPPQRRIYFTPLSDTTFVPTGVSHD